MTLKCIQCPLLPRGRYVFGLLCGTSRVPWLYQNRILEQVFQHRHYKPIFISSSRLKLLYRKSKITDHHVGSHCVLVHFYGCSHCQCATTRGLIGSQWCLLHPSFQVCRIYEREQYCSVFGLSRTCIFFREYNVNSWFHCHSTSHLRRCS